MPDHESHLLGRDVLRCYDEVAFVFAVGGVEDDDEFAVSEGGNGGFDAVEVQLRLSVGLHLQAVLRQQKRCFVLVCRTLMWGEGVGWLVALLPI